MFVPCRGYYNELYLLVTPNWIRCSTSGIRLGGNSCRGSGGADLGVGQGQDSGLCRPNAPGGYELAEPGADRIGPSGLLFS